jgi:DNA-binding MarR family transcriptional regulator
MMLGALTTTEFDFLELISLHPVGLTRDDIAARLGIKADSATTRILRLKRKGLVQAWSPRRNIPALVTLTTLGRRELAAAFAVLDRRVAA